MSLQLEEVFFRYEDQGPWVLEGISLEIPRGSTLGIAGGTGSGKTTLLMHLNGLLLPQKGRLLVDGEDPHDPHLSRQKRAARRRWLRRHVGLVFQYPENQLFEETVEKDIAFGPKNLGLPEAEIQARVERSMAALGLSFDLKGRSPFQLSGGQMRRVAVAGVLAMEPEVLVLDEPTAGLDPLGRQELLQLLLTWKKDHPLRTIIYVSHRMDEMALLAERLVVIHRGKIVAQGPPARLFLQEDLFRWGLEPPPTAQLLLGLKTRGLEAQVDRLDPREVALAIARARQKGAPCGKA
ncbi:MAG: ATP-binding cassette domain-containing protein [Bacillota bacterium]|nr:ATP-binding cassette domain-containing protein [Bacillota bacterium]